MSSRATGRQSFLLAIMTSILSLSAYISGVGFGVDTSCEFLSQDVYRCVYVGLVDVVGDQVQLIGYAGVVSPQFRLLFFGARPRR